jgi:L-lysine 2,3-aminomutase
MVSLEFDGLGAGEIKRHPEIGTLLVTGGNCADVMTKVLNWLTEAVN